MDHIIVHPERIGEVSYIPGDRIDLEVATRHGLLDETLIKQLKRLDRIAEATPETFGIAIARRAPDDPWPPRGFTEAYLVEAGLIGSDATPEPPIAPAAKKAGPVTHVTLTDEKVSVGPYFLQPAKRGKFTFWTAAAADGAVLRASMFKNREDGAAFLEALSTQAAAPVTPDPSAETEDAGDLQSDPGLGDRQDPPADR